MRDLQNDYENGAYNNYVGYNEKIGYNQKIIQNDMGGFYVYALMTFTKECNIEGTCWSVPAKKSIGDGELIIEYGDGAATVMLTEAEVIEYMNNNPLSSFIKIYPDDASEEVKSEEVESVVEINSKLETVGLPLQPPQNNIPVDGGNKTYNDSYFWYDLDEWAYKEHFLGDNCYIAIKFNHSNHNSGYDIKRNLPVYPEDITFNGSTNYASADIIGRPGTIAGYVNTSDITTQFSLHLHRELQTYNDSAAELAGKTLNNKVLDMDVNLGNNQVNKKIVDKNGVDEIVALIQAAQYPKRYVDGISTPIVTYKFGDTIITGKQTSFSTKWSGPKIDNIYMDCVITIAVSHTPNGIIYFNDVAGIPYGDEMTGGTLLSGYDGNPRQFG